MQACIALLAGLVALCSGVAHYREPLHPGHKQFGHPYKLPPQHQFHPHKHPGHSFGHPYKFPVHQPHKPFHYRRPPHPPRNNIRPPARPPIAKPAAPAPPPFQPPGSWSKAPSHFQPPVVRETFLSAAQFNGVQVHDEDKGPIHTIPAPNLSPNDRPSQIHQHVEKTHSDHRASDYSGYQVSEEDPSAYKPGSPQPSYFAPDPDPSLPTIGVPQTTDPLSQPSNGRAPPPDLEQQQPHYPTPDGGSGNVLSHQDLYKLLHQQDGGQMTVDLYQQYLQAAAAAQQPYQQLLLYPQQYQQQVSQLPQQHFNPQFENFNYNEQTQEGPYGSDSFPSASINVGVKRTISKDTKVSGESPNSIPGQSYVGRGKGEDSDDGVFSNQVEYEDEGSTEEYEGETPAPNLLVTNYYASLPNKEAAETLATLAVAGNINNQIMRKPTKEEQNGQRYIAENEANKAKTIRIEVGQQETTQKEESNQQYRVQEKKEEAQSYQNHHMGGHKENKDKPKLPFTNNEMRMKQTIRTEQHDHGETLEYSEEEILEPSDKGMGNNNLMLQNGMRMYQNMYRSKNENKQTQEPAEEQSYEDSEGDYTQEEEKEIEKNIETKTTEKTSPFNAHQNRLPFGAKLRPKRV